MKDLYTLSLALFCTLLCLCQGKGVAQSKNQSELEPLDIRVANGEDARSAAFFVRKSTDTFITNDQNISLCICRLVS